jgi:hypothetical protein
MKRFLAIAILVAAYCGTACGQCQTIRSGHPRIYLPNAAYGTYPTVLARLQAARAAHSTEWQAMLTQATPYLTGEPSAYYYDTIGMEMALIYQVNTTTYAAYGARAPHFMYEALQYIAPTVDITAATNGNPTVFTTASAHGLSTGSYKVPVWGGTGNWAAFNQASRYAITVIDSTHFSVAIDSTSFGALTGSMTVSSNGFAQLNAARWETPMMAAMYDWAHAELAGNLTTDQLNMIQNVMASAISYMTATPYEWNGSTPTPITGISNHFIGPLNGSLQMDVALSGDSIPSFNAGTICSTLRSNFLLAAPIYGTGLTGSGYQVFPLAHGGAYVESTEYAPEVEFYLMDYLEVMLGATGENLYSTVSTFPVTGVQFLFHDVSPGKSSSGGHWGELFPYGDILYSNQHTKTLNGITRQVMEQLVFYLCSSHDNTDCAYGEWWLKNVFTETQMNTQGNTTISPTLYAASEFLFYDPTLAATNPDSTYGTDYIADGYSLMLSRSAWSSSATWVGFKGGALRGNDGDHWHSDILSFEIYRNGDWLTSNLTNYGGAKLTRFSNAPLPETSMFGTPYEGSNPPSQPNSVFAWGGTGMISDGSITQHEFNTTLGYTYAEADATTAYNGQSNPYTLPAYTAQTTGVIRDFLYLKPDTYIVEDRLAYSTAMKAEWNIQALANPGTPSGHSFTLGSLLGNNALNVAVVSPASPSYSVATPATQATELTSAGCSRGAGVGCPSQWRVQVTSGNSVGAEQYFMVMQSGPTGFTPLPVSSLAATNAIAAQFGAYVVGGMTDMMQTGVTRSYTYTQIGNVQHLFMGLKPSTAYSVIRSAPGSITISDGTGGANDVTSTSGGVLLFNTSVSGTFP